MTAHAPLPPSGAACWVKCAQWPAMNKLYGGEDTPESLEGRVAHHVLAEAIQGRWLTAGTLVQASDTGEMLAVTDDMLDGAAVFVDDLHATVPEGWAEVVVGADMRNSVIVPGVLYVECMWGASPFIHPDCWGTPDVLLRRADRSTIVWDYKYGHRKVEAVGNWQCAAYLAPLAMTAPPQVRIVQPRNYEAGAPVRVWSPTAIELEGMWEDLRLAAKAAMGSPRDATVGEQCRYCPGRHACGPLQAAGNTWADFAASTATVQELPPTHAGREMRYLAEAIATLEARRSGLEAVVTSAYRRGERGLGWAIERAAGRRVWTASVEQIEGVGMMAGKLLLKPPAPVTPTQAIAAGIPAELVESMSERKPGGEKLVIDTETKARKAFFEE